MKFKLKTKEALRSKFLLRLFDASDPPPGAVALYALKNKEQIESSFIRSFLSPFGLFVRVGVENEIVVGRGKMLRRKRKV